MKSSNPSANSRTKSSASDESDGLERNPLDETGVILGNRSFQNVNCGLHAEWGLDGTGPFSIRFTTGSLT